MKTEMQAGRGTLGMALHGMAWHLRTAEPVTTVQWGAISRFASGGDSSLKLFMLSGLYVVVCCVYCAP